MTKKHIPNSIIEDQASDWVIRLDAGELTQEDAKELEVWLRQSEDHVQAFLDLSELYELILFLPGNETLNVDQIISQISNNIIPLEDERIPRKSVFAHLQSNWVRSGIAAVFLAMTGMIAYQFAAPSVGIQSDFYAAAIGQQRTIELSDGSIINLNTNTKVEVAYTANERLVRLEEGEAFFDVVTNPDLPFYVIAEDKFVRVLGTSFVVHRTKESVQFAVETGRVALGEMSGMSSDLNAIDSQLKDALVVTTMEKGDTAVWQHESDAPQLSEIILTNIATWRRGRLVFTNERLEDVVREFNRYNRNAIVLEVDEAIKDMRLSAEFAPNDLETFERFLKSSRPNIEINHTANSIIIRD